MTTNLKMQNVPIDSLAPNPWNTNHVSPENEHKLDESVKRFGVFKPIIVRTLPDGTYEILGGEHRWGAAKRLGYTEIPIVNLGEISDKRAKEIGLADNGRYGDDDTLQLAGLLKELGAEDVASFLPYTDTELDSIFSSSTISLDELDNEDDPSLPDLPSVSATPTTQVMRFKTPIEDVAWITQLIEHTMKAEGFKSEDSLSNAGNALVHILRKYREDLTK